MMENRAFSREYVEQAIINLRGNKDKLIDLETINQGNFKHAKKYIYMTKVCEASLDGLIQETIDFLDHYDEKSMDDDIALGIRQTEVLIDITAKQNYISDCIEKELNKKLLEKLTEMFGG